jgi:hypothetical protein
MDQRILAAGLALGVVTLAHGCTIRDITEVPVASVEVQPSSFTVLEGETRQLTARVKDESGNALPSGAVTWSSDAPAVFSIDRSGRGTALASGQARVWATLAGTRGSAEVSVGAGPRIVLDEPSILFLGAVGAGSGSPDRSTLRITNGGGGSLGGLSATVLYSEGAASGWLSLALESTSAPTTLTVTALLGQLEEGVFDATLVLASPDARNSPVTVTVQAVVTLDHPIIMLSSTALEFEVEAADAPPTPVPIQVTNRGGGVLSNLSAMILYLGGGGWLSADLAGATAPTEMLVQPDPSGLSPGTYIAAIRVSGPGAINTPLSLDVTLTVKLGPVSPGHSTASVPDGRSGDPTILVVQARDKGGNPLSSGGATVVVTVRGANAAGPMTATDVGDGTYTVTYTPVVAGTDSVAITMDGTPISGSPFTSTVGVGAASPANSAATVPPGAVGSPTAIVVQARDGGGNPLTSGGATVVVTVSGANNPGALTVTDRGDGTYTASYIPTAVGTDHVAITMNGTPISGSPFTSTVGTGAVSPARSTATVPDGTAGLPTTILIQARDGGGNPLTSGGATVVVIVSGANNPGALTVTDRGDGTYAASYTPTVAGTDHVAITMNGTPISGSPFTSTVGAGAVSPAHSTATVPDGAVGLPTDIVVQARDGNGNPLTSGGATVVVTISGANAVGPITATDMGDGTYSASYTPAVAGTDSVAITMDGTPISGSPFTSTVTVWAVSPAHSTATVPDGTAGLPTDIVVQARDGSGNPWSSGGATVVVTVSGANAVGPITATDVGDGTYTASYVPTVVGTDHVAITMDGTPISGSPFTSTVGAGAVSPAHSTATVPDGAVGLPTDIVVQARDGNGNPLTSGGATVVVTISGANAVGPITATDVGDGTYTASYTPTVAGTDHVAITMNGTPISGSPYLTTVGAGAASPAHSTATVPDGTAGLPTDIVVQARDGNGNPLTSGGATVVVTISGANAVGPMTATDMGDGTYTASYTPAVAGTDSVAITMDGTPISGSPFTSTVVAPVLTPANSTATVTDGTAGLPTAILVQARDQRGEPWISGGVTVLITVFGANPVGSLLVTDEGDGTYTASYTPTVAGTDSVAITMDGTPISGSPYLTTVGAGAASPAHSTATVPDGVRKEPTQIVVQARDAHGNPVTVGGETVVVTVTGTNDTGPITATDVNDGTYTASYTPHPVRTGLDYVTITMNGTPISGSPYLSTVR